jgi:hypothetical protein
MAAAPRMEQRDGTGTSVDVTAKPDRTADNGPPLQSFALCEIPAPFHASRPSAFQRLVSPREIRPPRMLTASAKPNQ